MSKKSSSAAGSFVASHPGSQEMPRWNTGELIDAPRFTWRNWAAMLGPGLMMGGSAIGGGEWLMGPQITARYGGALLWLATLSILAQVIYNIEISRYTLYTGEPIFTGKFRTKPGPTAWLLVYLVLDIGAVIPYLASTAATPVFMLIWGDVPNTASTEAAKQFLWMQWTDKQLLWSYGCAIFLLAMVPLVFGGKIYNSLRAVMTVKIVTLLGFLLLLGLLYSEPRTWWELARGFFLFGNVPVNRAEDANGNGARDPGEADWDGDGRLDVVEPKFSDVPGKDAEGNKIIWKPAQTGGDLAAWVQLSDTEERPYQDKEGQQVTRPDNNGDGKPDSFRDLDGDGLRDGDNIDNIFVAVAQGRSLSSLGFDWSVLALLCAMIAISGQGGLSNTPVSNYTRDQGWGMGHHVGAIPSVIGGHHLELSHVGTVFEPTAESLPRWKRWYRHVLRDQLVVWMPACFIGLALPAMLSAEFLPKGTEAKSWTAAGMTAGAIQERVADPAEFIAESGDSGWRGARNAVVRALAKPRIAGFFWFMVLFCGILTLAPTMSSSADGVIRRWVDVFWTASATLRRLDPRNIRLLYFGVLCGYIVLGLLALTLLDPDKLLKYASQIFNYALGISCFHALALNLILLPKEIRPGWFVRICMVLAGTFFLVVAGLTTYAALR